MDGDGIAELIDEDAYGGWQSFDYAPYEMDYGEDDLSAFYPATLHLYVEVNYYWFSEESEYGTVLIPVIN